MPLQKYEFFFDIVSNYISKELKQEIIKAADASRVKNPVTIYDEDPGYYSNDAIVYDENIIITDTPEVSTTNAATNTTDTSGNATNNGSTQYFGDQNAADALTYSITWYDPINVYAVGSNIVDLIIANKPTSDQVNYGDITISGIGTNESIPWGTISTSGNKIILTGNPNYQFSSTNISYTLLFTVNWTGGDVTGINSDGPYIISTTLPSSNLEVRNFTINVLEPTSAIINNISVSIFSSMSSIVRGSTLQAQITVSEITGIPINWIAFGDIAGVITRGTITNSQLTETISISIPSDTGANTSFFLSAQMTIGNIVYTKYNSGNISLT